MSQIAAFRFSNIKLETIKYLKRTSVSLCLSHTHGKWVKENHSFTKPQTPAQQRGRNLGLLAARLTNLLGTSPGNLPPVVGQLHTAMKRQLKAGVRLCC